jgi:hypothetical protein
MGTVVMSQQGIIKFETREKAPKSGGFFYNTLKLRPILRDPKYHKLKQTT